MSISVIEGGVTESLRVQSLSEMGCEAILLMGQATLLFGKMNAETNL